MLLNHPQHALAVGSIGLERPANGGEARRLAERFEVHDRGQRARHAASGVGIVAVPHAHDKSPEVGVAQAEGPVEMAVMGNLLGGITGAVHDDFLRGDEDIHRRLESLHIERSVRFREFHQVERGQVAGRVIEEHVFRAGIAGVDRTGVRAGVPALNRVLVLHAGVPANPGSFGDAIQNIAGFVGGSRFVGIRHPARAPVLVVDRRLHKGIGHAHTEVFVLKTDRSIRLAVEVAAVALLDQRPGLFLLIGFGLNKFQDVGVMHLQ